MMSFSWFSRFAIVVLTAQGYLITNILAKTKTKSSSETNFDVKAKPGQYTCPCGKSFETQSGLLQHMTATGHDKKYKGKSDVISQEDNLTNTPPKRQTLYRSKSIDRDDKVESLKERRRSIDELEKESIAIDKLEQRNANTEYSYNLRKIVDHIRTQESGKIYSADFRKAGSYSMKTKVGKADEFDTNIVLKIDVKEILTEGKLGYIYDDKRALDVCILMNLLLFCDRLLSAVVHASSTVKLRNTLEIQAHVCYILSSVIIICDQNYCFDVILVSYFELSHRDLWT